MAYVDQRTPELIQAFVEKLKAKSRLQSLSTRIHTLAGAPRPVLSRPRELLGGSSRTRSTNSLLAVQLTTRCPPCNKRVTMMDLEQYTHLCSMLRFNCIHGVAVDLLTLMDGAAQPALPAIDLPSTIHTRASQAEISTVATQTINHKVNQFHEKFEETIEVFRN